MSWDKSWPCFLCWGSKALELSSFNIENYGFCRIKKKKKKTLDIFLDKLFITNMVWLVLKCVVFVQLVFHLIVFDIFFLHLTPPCLWKVLYK